MRDRDKEFIKLVDRMQKAVWRDWKRVEIARHQAVNEAARRANKLTTFDGIFKQIKNNNMPVKTKPPVPRFEIVRGKGKAAKEFFWRFISRNGKELARSSETYKRRAGVMRSIKATTRGGDPIIDPTK